MILCTEAWIQGCLCKASALGGSMWFLRDSPWDGQNVGLPWQGPFEMVGAGATIHYCTFLDILCGMIMVAELYHALSQPKIVATSIEKYLLPLFWPRCGRWISQMFKFANDAAWIRHGAEGSLGRFSLPPLPASISLLCSSRLGQQSCALWSRILGPWTLKGAESTEEVSCDTGNWNHKDIRHIGTPKKRNCCILLYFVCL